jgi:hypothetical protein
VQLSEIQSLNLDEIEDHLCIVAARHPMSEIGQEMQFLTEGFQARGIFFLLLDLDTESFFINLQRSAHCRRFFLRKSREQQSADRTFLALSRTDALFDSIAGGDWSLALDIYDLSPASWVPEGEYQEDYCYHALIHAYLASLTGRDDLPPRHWLGRLETVVAEIPDSPLDVARLELCTQFVEGNAERFWPAFESLAEISQHLAEKVPLADGRLFEFPWLAADRYVSTELLAWIALARARGLEIPQREFARCPSVAWTDKRNAVTEDLFVELEMEFGL